MTEQDNEALTGRSTPAAEGERRAVTGYYWQYRVAAWLILRGLGDGTLRWIRVADPEAERVDDVQIGSQGRLDAYQIKWSQYGGTATFQDLVRKGSEPSLVRKLADGWRTLSESYSGDRVVVHLLTNKVPSTSSYPPVGEPSPTPRHFAAFIEQVWRPSRNASPGSGWQPPTGWQPAWATLESSTGLTNEDFETFVQHCELDYGDPFPQPGELTLPEHRTLEGDLDAISELLERTVALPERIVQLNREKLLNTLGWANRFRPRSTHTFPIDELLYEPFEGTVSRLEESLERLPGGYVAVLGAPGSGKSTLLTRTLRSRPERLVKYYAFVPNAADPASLRGESLSFLHDVVVALEQQGFRTRSTLPFDDRANLLNRLHEQLELLHEDFTRTGRRTVILIDGLDYIARELRPEHSLLRDLPAPTQIPDGVFFVLGSQTDQLQDLPSSVQLAMRDSGRRIEMEALSRAATLRIIERMADHLSTDQMQRVYQLTGGHPLSLGYILNRLRDVHDSDSTNAILEDMRPYEGDIEAQYHSHWRQMEQDLELTNLLGLICRLRGAIDLAWLETWSGRVLVDRIRVTLPHYFKKETANRWYFSHDSFRSFLEAKTAEASPGESDAERHRGFHRELADRCAASPSESKWRWDELFHRFHADQNAQVLEIATLDWFRAQFMALRPLEEIEADIKLALTAAGILRDEVALARTILAGAELAQRNFYLDTASPLDLLLSLNPHLAVDHIRDGSRLRVSEESALASAVSLQARGLNEEAARIFGLAAPLELLHNNGTIDDPTGRDIRRLEAWVAASPHFLDIPTIVSTIRMLRRNGDGAPSDEGDSSRALQSQLLFALGKNLIEGQRWHELKSVVAELDDAADIRWWFWLRARAWAAAWQVSERELARSWLETTLERVNIIQMEPEARVAVAEGVLRILGDRERCRVILEGVHQPPLAASGRGGFDSGFQPFLQRFRLNRLLFALGDRRTPSELVPDPENLRDLGMAYFERTVCVLARIWASAWIGRRLEPSELVSEARAAVRLFYQSPRAIREWSSWYICQGARGQMHEVLVDAAAEHGREAVEALRELFDIEWSDENLNQFWPAPVKRKVIMALHRQGITRSWVSQQLDALDEDSYGGDDIAGRIENFEKQAESFLELGEPDRAREELTRLLRSSFAIGYRKDYQLDDWIAWLADVLPLEPDAAPNRLSWLARCIPSLDEITEGPAARYAANALIRTAFRWSPRRAVALFKLFYREGALRHQEAIREILVLSPLDNDGLYAPARKSAHP